MKTIITAITLEQAKATDIVSYLAHLGFNPYSIRNNDYWYHSPFRNEQTPSFKVNRSLNLWYDHGAGKGGTMIDFGIRFFQCSLPEFLEKLSTGSPAVPLSFEPHLPALSNDANITVTKEMPLTSPALLHYLKQRKIPVETAREFCLELHYQLYGKSYYGIGFRNDSGAFEIRNRYFKGSTSPKGITTMDNGSDHVQAFEGFMDFLTFKTLYQNPSEPGQDFVVLNSLSLFEKARSFMEKHTAIGLYLDRDPAGVAMTRKALSLHSGYTDESHRYSGYKDLNEMAVSFGNPPKVLNKPKF